MTEARSTGHFGALRAPCGSDALRTASAGSSAPLSAALSAALFAASVVLAGCATTGPGNAPVADRVVKSAPTSSVMTVESPPPVAEKPTRRSSGAGGAYYLDDGPGRDDATRLATLALRPDPEPRDEPLHPRANRPYSALGNRYEPMTRREPFRQTGVASWYGRRYHGNATSTGEPYDMYGMTAAHPTLPLPSYVRVTNRANGRSVVVRVNDRGPFLRDRVIDLSYLAAHKLDYVAAGSASVDVEVLLTAAPPASAAPVAMTGGPVGGTGPAIAPAPGAALAPGHFLQLGAFRARDGAEVTAGRLRGAPELQGTALAVIEDGGFYRIKAGPWNQRDDAAAVASAVTARTGLKPVLVERR